MTMTFFEVLSPVINREVAFVSNQLGITKEETYELIIEEAERNQAEWFSDRVPNLNYMKPECRLAYLYIVAAANANTFQYVLETDVKLNDYVLQIAKERCHLRICALGAGPGTELLGIAKFFEKRQLGMSISVDFHLLDKVKEWASSWYAIRDEINNSFRTSYGVNRATWPMIPSGSLVACDVTKINQLTFLGDVWNQDIYVINFLLSEIFKNDAGLQAFLSKIASFAPPGARFVFIERRGSMWVYRMKAIAASAGLSMSDFIESNRLFLDVDEVPANLGDIFEAIGDQRLPRLGWNVVYSVGVKN